MIHLVTTADTEILACARAVERLRGNQRLRGAEPDFPTVRCFNPGPTGQGEEASVEELVAEIVRGARVVVCRVLGGRRGNLPTVDRLCADSPGARPGCRALVDRLVERPAL